MWESLCLYKVSCMTRRRQWQPTPVLLPGKSHGQRSLVGYSPWGREESDMTERLHFHFSLSCIGEGNGNPLQCSCLENPRDSRAWWTAVYGVTQSRTWLNRLSISSSMHDHSSSLPLNIIIQTSTPSWIIFLRNEILLVYFHWRCHPLVFKTAHLEICLLSLPSAVTMWFL